MCEGLDCERIAQIDCMWLSVQTGKVEHQVPAFPVCGVRFFFLVVNVETEVSFQLVTLSLSMLQGILELTLITICSVLR